jgi:CRP-like cAMP-binding protein
MNQVEKLHFTEAPVEEKEKLARLLDSINVGKREVKYSQEQTIYSQGEPGDAVFLIQEGQVRLSVVSVAGKEATLAVMGRQEFFGVTCLGEQRRRLTSAMALQPTTLLRIERAVMIRNLWEDKQLFDFFLSHLLSRTVTLQNDLCAQILEPSEKRLVRVLLKLTQFGEKSHEQVKVPKISHDRLATMVGTTRSRVTFFMNRFKKLGFVDYGTDMFVDPDRLSDLLQKE